MKAVILAGGMGTRLAEETVVRPKPMVRIGPQPILWHILKIYSAHGINDFVICCGYKGYMIKEYFANYGLHSSDITFDLGKGSMEVHANSSEPWRVTVVDTGLHSMTGGRLRRVRKYLDPDEPFCFTYGDSVADVDVTELVKFHKRHGKLATMTAIQPPSRFGVLAFDGERITDFEEKPHGEGGWINGGFFVLDPKVIDYIESDDMPWEHAPMRRLVAEGQLHAHMHHGFWQCMDTLRDKNTLQALWESGSAPWKAW